MALVTTEYRGAVATLVMNNVEKRNALSAALIDEMIAAFQEFRERQVRVVILRAAPGMSVWSAGHDIGELPETRRDPLGWSDPLRVLVRAINDFPAPVIALVGGSVWGGACEVAMACDIVVASAGVTFALTPAKLGVPYNITGLLTFLNRVGMGLLKEMVFTGKPVAVQRLEQVGVVNWIVPAEGIEEFVDKMAEDIAANAPLSIAVMKEEIRILAGAHALPPDRFERVQGLRRMVYDSEDYREGLHAFKEKRKPHFTGH
ncbi:MAG TPA: methylmalonyl-CoA decarboxylase [Azospirillaceae bacterium]|nr:methylmalonyl-CoA decarboxylase [Azospirillaceae bacterium]